MQPRLNNISRYYLFSAFSFTPVMLSVLVLFWQQNGMNMFDVFLLQSIFAVAIVILEIPTGMVADRMGKKSSLIYATAIMTAGQIFYSLGTNFYMFLIAELILAIGLSLLSGADSALLYDTLKKTDRINEYQKIEGRARAIQLISFAVCNLIGGFVGSYSYRATLWLSVIGPLLSFFIVLGFKEANENEAVKGKKILESYKELITGSLVFMKKQKFVRWLVLFSAVITGSGGWLLWMYQPYMEYSGLPVWAFGIAFAIFNLFAAIMSSYAYAIERKLGKLKTCVLLMVLQVATLFLMSLFIFPLSFLFILGHQAVRGISRPVINDWILQYTYADKRATVLSMASMSSRLFFAITAPLVGFISENSSFKVNLNFQAVFLILIFTVLLFTYRRIPVKYFQVKDSVILKQ